jgi:peptidyl-prolyl cis-trans isomerase C
MKLHTKSLVLLFAASAMVSTVSAATSDSGQSSAAKPDKLTALFGDQVIAKGKGLEIRRSQLDDALVSVRASAAANNQTIPPEQMAMIEPGVLEKLIEMQLLLSQATDADKAKGKTDSTKSFDQIKTKVPSEEMLNRQLKSMGLTQDELKKKLNEEATAQAVIERELKVDISDADAKKFYDDNPSKFEQPEMVRASHILISTKDPMDMNPNLAQRKDLPDDQKAAKRKQAEDLLKRARAGEDFAKLAKEYSDDPGSKDKGGEYTFPRGQMMPEFEAAAFSLKTNEISDIVTTTYGYHIIKLSEKMPAKQVEFDKVKDNIKAYLAQQQIRKKAPDFFAKLKKDANVEILDESLKPKEPSLAPTGPSGADTK